MAIADLDRLTADGVRIPWRAAIRLNAFGVRCERRSEIDNVIDLPRVAIIDDLVLREPTIAAEIWLARAARMFDVNDEDTHLQLWCFACVLDAPALPPPEDVEAVRVAVTDFTARRLGAFTRRRLWAALMYLLTGDDATAGEKRAKGAECTAADDEPPCGDVCLAVGVLHNGMVMRLGTPGDLQRLTRREVESCVAYSEAIKLGEPLMKSQRGERLAHYFGVLDEITKEAQRGESDD